MKTTLSKSYDFIKIKRCDMIAIETTSSNEVVLLQPTV